MDHHDRSVDGQDFVSVADGQDFVSVADGQFFVSVADGQYVGQTLSTRFPIYTRGNAGEVYPEVHYPLSFTTSVRRGGLAGVRAVISTGAFTADELDGDDTAVIAVIAGYSYLNLSIVRTAAVRTPGQTAADADFQYYGASDAPVHVIRKGDKNVRRSFAVIRYALGVLKRADDPQMDFDAAMLQRWQATLPDRSTCSDAELLTSVRAAVPIFEELFENHLKVSSKAGVPIAVLSQLCAKQLGDPSLVTQLLGGIGNVESAAPALSLWKLGRLVAADETLTALFDDGVPNLASRLRAYDSSDSGVTAFLHSFDDFLEKHGCRGPNEWETACDSWGTNPELPLGMIDRLRGADQSNDPEAKALTLSANRVRAHAAAKARLKPWHRKRFDQAVLAASAYSQRREQAKTTVIRGLHEVRLMLLELDQRVRNRTGTGQPKDLWFLIDDELDAYVHQPTDRPCAFADRIAERRRMRALLSTRTPPFIVNGLMPPFETWVPRVGVASGTARLGQVFTGIPGCPGIARGRAVVVTDPTDLRGIGPGDVLVAPLTDPSWTPLFLAAEAVVVDVGAVLSHAVIVSRELGIPSVVSVTDATRTIPDGAIIEIDGASGTVKVIELP
jgi:rifampicin phosphotransferase